MAINYRDYYLHNWLAFAIFVVLARLSYFNLGALIRTSKTVLCPTLRHLGELVVGASLT